MDERAWSLISNASFRLELSVESMRLDDKWLDKIAQKVEAYEEQAPAPDWQRIQAGLDKELVSRKRKVVPLYSNKMRWAVAAALFVGVLSYGVYMATNTSFWGGKNIQLVAEDNYLESILPQIQLMSQPPKVSAALAQKMRLELPTNKPLARSSQLHSTLAHAVVEAIDNDLPLVRISEQETAKDEQEQSVSKDYLVSDDKAQPTADTDKSELKGSHSNLYTQLGDSRFRRKTKQVTSKPKGFGLLMGSGGALNFSKISSDQAMRVLEEVNIEALATDSPEILKTIQIRNGIPYIEKEVKQKEYDHSQPVSFGLNYRFPLTSHLFLETGLVYTYLSSKIKDFESGEARSYRQKLHYLGVPLKLNWSFYEHNRFSFYASGGGMFELGVAGKVDGENKRPTRPQFSAAAGVGAQIGLSKNIGFYIEPGMAYYFNDGSKFETIRKKKPFNFNLNTGIRLTF